MEHQLTSLSRGLWCGERAHTHVVPNISETSCASRGVNTLQQEQRRSQQHQRSLHHQRSLQLQSHRPALGNGVLSGGEVRYAVDSHLPRSTLTAPMYNQQQKRGIIRVDVQGNKVDRSLRMLRRKLIDEGIRDTWMKQRVFVKPCQERKQVIEEAKRRDRTREFKEKMRWILRRKARGY